MLIKFNNLFFFKKFTAMFLIKCSTFISTILYFKSYYLIFRYYVNMFHITNYFTLYLFSISKQLLERLNIYSIWNSLYITEFFLEGVYYRIKYYEKYNILAFILGYSHYIIYKLPENIRAVVHMKRRRFFLYGFDLVTLNNKSIEIQNLKYPNVFKGKGIKLVGYNYRRKVLAKKAR